MASPSRRSEVHVVSSARAVTLAGLLSLLQGCMLGTGVPFSVDAPGQSLDVDAERARFEADLCADPASADCAVLMALDESDGDVASPPALPAQLPRQVRMSRDQPDIDVVDVEPWLAAQIAEHGLVPAQSFSLGSEASGALRDAIERASLHEATLVFEDNRLSFELPPFEIWAGQGEAGSIEEAIAAGTATRIAVTESLPSGADGETSLTFSEGGSALLLEALRDGGSLSLRSDPSFTFALEDGAEPETLARPGGSVTVALRFAGTVAIPLSQLTNP